MCFVHFQGLIRIAFDWFKSAFNTQKVNLEKKKKKYSFGKKFLKRF